MASSAEGGAAVPVPRASLEGRRAVVTGASSGIGLEVARRLAGAGAEVVMVARSRPRLETAAAAVGGVAEAVDSADAAAMEALRARVEADGAVDILVNAAGAFALAPVARTDPGMFDRMVAANLRAPFVAIRTFLPAMLTAGSGAVVTIGSVAGRVPFPENGAYAAAKFGVRGLHAVLEQELVGTGVRCTLVEPAATDTPLWDAIDPDGRDDFPSRAAMLSPGAVADAVLYAITRPRDVHVPRLTVQRS